MRISFFVPRCTPDNSHGRYVVELVRRLGGQLPVTVYAGTFSPLVRSVARCRFLPVPNRPAFARVASMWAASVVAARRQPADIVHIQGADAPVGNVVTAHCCNAVMRAAAGDGARLHRRVNYAIGVRAERYCMSKASTRRIIAVSQQVKGEIEGAYGVAPQRIVVIPNGVDAEAFHPRHRAGFRMPVRERFGVTPDQFLVLFVGGDYRLKGLAALLEAARRVAGAIRVIAVGVRPDAALVQLVREKDLQQVVTFTGYTTDVASFYAAADCFALPSRYDTFSLATLEAMASGLPVIVSRAAGVSELLSPGRDCLMLENPNDVDALAQGLERLTQDQVLRSRLGVEARKTAELCSWDDVATRTFGVYREALASAG
jgi:UDP-glucose:(heptosyl)LPS alpha-1,3-glucosyltransferase